MRKIFAHPLILSLILVAIAVFFNGQGWLDAPKNAFFQLTYSFQKTIYRCAQKINNSADFFVSTVSINEENINLKKENAEFLGEIARLKEAARENDFFRRQIGLAVPEDGKLILASVIGQDLFGPNRYFFIDKGVKDGVKEKSVVITAGNLLVGRVVEAVDFFSKVQLLTDSSSRVNALIQDSGAKGLVKSECGTNLIMDLLSQGEDINEGETVVTSGLAGLFPTGLLIGQIQKIVSSDAQISQIAKIKLA
ncbi:MAG: rod shape-determining protein MreC, partial [Patescibacteria group bacterium]|nr:rod shape-determining protein MreC [Patescibacteria group bacterium]